MWLFLEVQRQYSTGRQDRQRVKVFNARTNSTSLTSNLYRAELLPYTFAVRKVLIRQLLGQHSAQLMSCGWGVSCNGTLQHTLILQACIEQHAWFTKACIIAKFILGVGVNDLQ